MLSTILVLGFALTAAITDLWRKKIYNWTTYPGILTGLVVSAFEPQGIGWEDSLLGIVGCGLMMVFCFLCFPKFGGGDVKLITMLAAFLGWYHGLECMLWTFVLAAILGLSILIWRFGVLHLLGRMLKQIWWLGAYRQWLPLTQEDRQALEPELFLAPAALVAVVIVKFSVFR
jgi:Flp pilus assembly protein protease CpaA